MFNIIETPLLSLGLTDMSTTEPKVDNNAIRTNPTPRGWGVVSTIGEYEPHVQLDILNLSLDVQVHVIEPNVVGRVGAFLDEDDKFQHVLARGVNPFVRVDN